MRYRTILLLHGASLVEVGILKLCLDRAWLVCNMVGIDSTYHLAALVATKNMLILAGYQMYFWSQKNPGLGPKRCLQPTALDRWIPACPWIFWIYSPLYYLFFSIAMLCLPNLYGTALQAWLLLMHGSLWHMCFPTQISQELRAQIRSTPADRLTRYIMELVHTLDSEANACPSMHCAFATFLACITYPFYPTLSLLFPPVVALSCLLSRQHLLVDILPGVALGGLHGLVSIVLL
ncbi:MAG: hypothetical protein AAFV97_02165 [Bacteroidota bacterium]